MTQSQSATAKTHEFAHVLPAQVEFWYHDNDSAELNQTDHEEIERFIKDGYIEGQFETTEGTLSWKIQRTNS